MRILFRTGLCVPTMVLAFSGLAAAQTPAKFDGVYAGVSATASGGSRCPAPEKPGPLTMSGGNVTSATGFFTGTVDATGYVVLHTKASTRFEGHIDGSGALQTGGGNGPCNYVVAWKKG